MKPILSALVIAASLPCAARQVAAESPAAVANESLEDIKKSMAAEKAQALEAYLVANPNANDAKFALNSLYQCYKVLGDDVRKLGTLERCYSVILKGGGNDVQDIGLTLFPMVELLLGSERVRNVAKAEALIGQARRDFADQAKTEGGKILFMQLDGMLNRPVVGGTLEIAFTALDGTRVDLAAMKGKVVLVDFWATWCAPCVAEQPALKAAYAKLHDKGFEVIGISLDSAGNKERLQNFLKKENLPWPQAFSGKGWDDEFAAKYGITGIPATFLIGKDGKIANIGVGGHQLEARLENLLR